MFFSLFLIAAINASLELPVVHTEETELETIITILTTSDTTEIITEPLASNTLTTTEENISPMSESSEQAIVEPIIITNAIEPSMLAYKHWLGTYSPETFTLSINGTEIAQGAQYTLPAETKTINISFYYSFKGGIYSGTKTASYQLNENITQAAITFSWKENQKVLLDNGTLLEITT